MILFLKVYTGPVAENAYRTAGLFQGQYKVSGTKIIKIKDNVIPDAEISTVLGNIETLKSRAETVGYSP